MKRDFEIAFRYYQKAANLGDSYGMHMVGVMYYDGLGVRRNYKRAVDYFRRALEHGETQALYFTWALVIGTGSGCGRMWIKHGSTWRRE